MTDDLVAFLRARYDEAAADAEATLWDGSGNTPDWALPASATLDTGGDTIHVNDAMVARHIARHDPAHVLRDIEAKRAIVDAHDRVWLTTNWRWVNLGSHTEKMPFPICKSCTPDTQLPEQSWPCPTLRHLSAVYDQHPDYQETWRP